MFLSTILLRLLSSCLHLVCNTFAELAAWISKTQNKADHTHGVKLSLHFPKCQLKNIPQQRLKLLSQLKTEKVFRNKIPACFQRAQYWNSSKLKMCPVIRQSPWCGNPSNALRMETSYDQLAHVWVQNQNKGSQHAEVTQHPHVYCSSIHNS